jgi:soluble lytic murein transglycosylase-like protein
MPGFRSLNKNHFSVRLVSNMLLEICLFTAISTPAAGDAVKSVVRPDASGRLVRRVLPASGSPLPPKPEVRSLIEEKARLHDVDADLVESVIEVESNYDPRAVSPKGALGLMQLIPATARRFGVRNVFDPSENIEGGVKYLKHLQGLFGGDRNLTLAAYNAGEAAVARYRGVPPFAETRDYVVKVGRRYQRARAQQPPAPAAAPQPKVAQFVGDDGRIYIVLR